MKTQTQRRLRATAKTVNPVGASPAIQSQWTYRPKRGLTVALTMIATPTMSAAHIADATQLLGGCVLSGFVRFAFVRFTMVFRSLDELVWIRRGPLQLW